MNASNGASVASAAALFSAEKLNGPSILSTLTRGSRASRCSVSLAASVSLPLSTMQMSNDG